MVSFFQIPLPFYAVKQLSISKIQFSPIMKKDWNFSQLWNHYALILLLVQNLFYFYSLINQRSLLHILIAINVLENLQNLVNLDKYLLLTFLQKVVVYVFYLDCKKHPRIEINQFLYFEIFLSKKVLKV